MLWSWVLTAIGVTGLYFAGKGVWWSWLIGLGAQALWLSYAIATGQWGFIVSAFAYGWVYARNAYRWWTRERRETAALNVQAVRHHRHARTCVCLDHSSNCCDVDCCPVQGIS